MAAFLHPALGEALAAAGVLVPMTTALILLAVILRGTPRPASASSVLLRWIASRPAPPAPSQSQQAIP
jgi:hypothetical protein